MRFISDNYNFTDSIIDKIELSSNLKDVVIVIDCFIGKDASSTKKILRSTCFYHSIPKRTR